MRNEDAPVGADDCIEAEYGFIGKTGEREYRLNELYRRGIKYLRSMLPQSHVTGFADEREQGSRQNGDEHDAKHHCRPKPG